MRVQLSVFMRDLRSRPLVTALIGLVVVALIEGILIAHLVTAGGSPVELSPRQFRLLTALVRNAGRILTHQQLAQVASGESGEATTGEGLRGAVSHLRKRIGSGPQRPQIVTEPQVGYRLISPAD